MFKYNADKDSYKKLAEIATSSTCYVLATRLRVLAVWPEPAGLTLIVHVSNQYVFSQNYTSESTLKV